MDEAKRNQAHDRALGLVSKQVLPVVTDTGIQTHSGYAAKLTHEIATLKASASKKVKRK